MNELLSDEEIKDLTKRTVKVAQQAKLTKLGVPFRLDGDRIIASREHLRQWILGITPQASSGVCFDSVK